MQSKNWDQRKDTASFVREGFPFDEGFPGGAMGRAFHLVTRDGMHYLAEVDYSTQYRAEGLTWQTVSARGAGGIWSPCRQTVGRHVVLCWKLHKEETEPHAAV